MLQRDRNHHVDIIRRHDVELLRLREQREHLAQRLVAHDQRDQSFVFVVLRQLQAFARSSAGQRQYRFQRPRRQLFHDGR